MIRVFLFAESCWELVALPFSIQFRRGGCFFGRRFRFCFFFQRRAWVRAGCLWLLWLEGSFDFFYVRAACPTFCLLFCFESAVL